ncbi:hypothetical protein JHD49_06705 [Sulfurimonas sp. SAG-AH-194-C21]|nr:hypothetical protein [Sulfurimonas sp. SAG-AH-194-C21]MDF1883624.1 hypothetical protein [Sulfurimonas sp. SAG-AH-194-C21]
MHTDQIAIPVLDGYKTERLSGERIDFLINQANEQLEEISQKEDIYSDFLKKIEVPEKLDKIILWILLMSNETVCEDYIDEFKKNFRDIIPVSDLADLLIHVIHLKKVQDIELDGIDFLLKYEKECIEEVDQFAFTNALLYIQKSKEVEMEF